jgi:hypothetical protein
MARRSGIVLVAMGLLSFLLSFLFGCGKKDSPSPFQQKDGAWYYDSTRIESADVPTFQALDEHHAKDKDRVYYGYTYREIAEFFAKKSRVFVVGQADPATFRCLRDGYARDRARMFFRGLAFPVKDIETFEILDNGFARDRVTGYYHQAAVPGSDGSSFTGLDLHYSKDRAKVFYSDLEPASGGPVRRSIQIPRAQPESFSLLSGGYAADAGQVYFQGKVITRTTSAFTVLTFDYAKNSTEVFYRGESVAGADAATFAILDTVTDDADARDARHTYKHGQRVASKP